MTAAKTTPPTVESRASQTLGTSGDPIYRAVARVLAARQPDGGTLVDVGCGTGTLWSHVRDRFSTYLGVDVLRYEGFPEDGTFIPVDLDTGRVALPDASADVVAAVETIEHLENPRALARELLRLARPGGLIIITTPNQLSLCSKLALVLKNRFPAFAEAPGLYPAHITALLEIDLLRIARECGLVDVQVAYTDHGRIPGTGRHWPSFLRGRNFSDNILISGRKPEF